MHLNSVEHFDLQLPWWEILAIGYHLDFHLSDLKFCLKPYFCVDLFAICEVTQATILTHYGNQHTQRWKNFPQNVSQLPQPWLSYRRQCSQTPKYQYITALPLTLASTSFLPCDKRTKWPPWTKRPITHQHRANVTKVSSRLTDKDSQPPVYQVCLGQRVYILPGALWATLGHLPPIPPTPQDTRPQGLQVAAHGKRAGWAKVRRCRA